MSTYSIPANTHRPSKTKRITLNFVLSNTENVVFNGNNNDIMKIYGNMWKLKSTLSDLFKDINPGKCRKISFTNHPEWLPDILRSILTNTTINIGDENKTDILNLLANWGLKECIDKNCIADNNGDKLLTTMQHFESRYHRQLIIRKPNLTTNTITDNTTFHRI